MWALGQLRHAGQRQVPWLLWMVTHAILPVDMRSWRPKIVLVETVHHDLLLLPPNQRLDPSLIVHLLEVMSISISSRSVHACMHANGDLYCHLTLQMQAFGWQRVQWHIYVIGHTGSMQLIGCRHCRCLEIWFILHTEAWHELAVMA